MPPLLVTNASETSVYPSNNNRQQVHRQFQNFQPFFNETRSTLNFTRGTVILRNSRGNQSTMVGGAGTYPLKSSDLTTFTDSIGPYVGNTYNLALETIPVSASFTKNSPVVPTSNLYNYLTIRKSGASSFDCLALENNDSNYRFVRQSNFTNALLPIGGYYLDAHRVNPGQTAQLQFDLILEGVYELDPSIYFNRP